MSLLKLTAQLYSESAKDAWKGMQRSWWAVPVLVGIWIVTLCAWMLLSPLGIIGGFIMFLVEAYLLGTYLSMVEVGVNGMRTLKWNDVRTHLGSLMQTCISVMFLFWIPQFILTLVYPSGNLILVPVAALAFNPIPEIVYQGRMESGMDIAGEALNFMQRNFPEWIVANVLIALPVAGFLFLQTGVADATVLLGVSEFFSPFFGFVNPSNLLLAVFSPFTAPILLFAPAIHFALLFRGQMYKRLAHSNRRKRAWQARF